MELYYQRQIEYWLKYVWLLVGFTTLIIAYYQQDQSIAWNGCLALSIISTLAIVPPWPIYKRHAIIWRGVEVEQPNKKN
jgi:hypothetical protein